MKLQSNPIRPGIDCIGVGAGAIIFKEDKILLSLRGPLAKNERGKWEIPGGAIEFGETIQAGLEREVQEELGIKIEVGEMLQLANHILPDEHQHWIAPTFICTVISGTPQVCEPGKCDRIEWFTLEEAAQLPLSKVTQQDIELLLKQRSKNL